MTLRQRLNELERLWVETRKAMGRLLVMDDRLTKMNERCCPVCGRQLPWKKLGPMERREISHSWRPGVPGLAKKLAKKYGVSVWCIRDIVRRKIRVNVEGDSVKLRP